MIDHTKLATASPEKIRQTLEMMDRLDELEAERRKLTTQLRKSLHLLLLWPGIWSDYRDCQIGTTWKWVGRSARRGDRYEFHIVIRKDGTEIERRTFPASEVPAIFERPAA